MAHGPIAAVAGPVEANAEPRDAATRPGIEPTNPDHWPAVVEAAALGGMVRQFALNCVPASFERDVLVLRLDPAAADRRTRQIEDRLVQGLSKFLGRTIRVVFETPHGGLVTPARQRVLAEQDRLAAAAAAFEQDPAVRGLRERFGADVDAASIKPGN